MNGYSFGTYIVAYSLLYFEQIKLDKVILCGSILPEDFDWALIFRRDQVGHVRNEYGAKDFWAGIVKHFVRGAGDTGRRGFGLDNETFAEQKFDYFGHSAFFYELHMKDHWVKHLRKAPSSFAVIHGRDIKDAAKFHEIFEVTGNIDEKVFGKLPHYGGQVIPDSLADEWIIAEPDIYTFLLDRRTGQMAGYINAMPLTDEAFARVLGGKVLDAEISADEIFPFLGKDSLKIYIMSIATDPEVRHLGSALYQEAFYKLVNGFFGKLIDYAEKGIIVSEFLAIGWTTEGKTLCEKILGMNIHAYDKFGHPIYHFKVEPRELLKRKKILPGLRELAKIYINKM
jgi:hypothetical protein